MDTVPLSLQLGEYVTTDNNFIFEHMASDQQLGVTTLSMDDINYYPIGLELKRLESFFDHILRSNPTKVKMFYQSASAGTMDDEQMIKLNHFYGDMSSTIKTHILYNEDFRTNGKFEHPIGCFWNPYTAKWTVNPGTTRIRVMNWMGVDKFTAVAYNTGGANVDYDIVFNNADEINNWNSDFHSIEISKLQDHYVPIVNFFAEPLLSDNLLIDYYERLREFWLGHSINSNFEDIIKWKDVTKPSVSIVVENTKNIPKALMLAVFHEVWEEDGISIWRD